MSAALHLHIGGRFTSVAIVPDSEWPAMWRVRTRDGRLSDMTNKTRAKDAAVAHARSRGLGGSEDVRWHHRETGSEAPPAAAAAHDDPFHGSAAENVSSPPAGG